MNISHCDTNKTQLKLIWPAAHCLGAKTLLVSISSSPNTVFNPFLKKKKLQRLSQFDAVK